MSLNISGSVVNVVREIKVLLFISISAHGQILVPKASTLENLKEKIEESIRQVDVALYFHQGVEIEFDDETLLNQVFSSEIEVVQVDVFLPSAAVVTIKSEKKIEILEKNGKIKVLEAGIEDETDLKPTSGTLPVIKSVQGVSLLANFSTLKFEV